MSDEYSVFEVFIHTLWTLIINTATLDALTAHSLFLALQKLIRIVYCYLLNFTLQRIS